MKHYSPTGRRNHGRPLKRLLDTWDRNGSTGGPTPWQIYDDDDENDPTQNKCNTNTDNHNNNNNPLQSVSQIHKSTYTKIKRKPTTTFETKINK